LFSWTAVLLLFCCCCFSACSTCRLLLCLFCWFVWQQLWRQWARRARVSRYLYTHLIQYRVVPSLSVFSFGELGVYCTCLSVGPSLCREACTSNNWRTLVPTHPTVLSLCT